MATKKKVAKKVPAKKKAAVKKVAVKKATTKRVTPRKPVAPKKPLKPRAPKAETVVIEDPASVTAEQIDSVIAEANAEREARLAAQIEEPTVIAIVPGPNGEPLLLMSDGTHESMDEPEPEPETPAKLSRFERIVAWLKR